MNKLYMLFLNCNMENRGNKPAEVSVSEYKVTEQTKDWVRCDSYCFKYKTDLDVIPTSNNLNIFAYTLDPDKIPDMIERMNTKMLTAIEENMSYFKMCTDKLKGRNLSKNNG